MLCYANLRFQSEINERTLLCHQFCCFMTGFGGGGNSGYTTGYTAGGTVLYAFSRLQIFSGNTSLPRIDLSDFFLFLYLF